METTPRSKFNEIMGWLHCPPMSMLIMAAILMGLAPFWPEPHLLQKARMLMQGETLKPIDIFDIFWHSWPLVWIALRLATPGAAGACRIPERKS